MPTPATLKIYKHFQPLPRRVSHITSVNICPYVFGLSEICENYDGGGGIGSYCLSLDGSREELEYLS